MGLISNIKLFASITKVVNEVKALKEKNNAVIDKVKDVLDKIITALKELSEILPSIGKLIDDIINIFKGVKK